MTAVQQMLKELQENFPKQMADMYDSNQLLLEDIALKAKKMEKEEKIEFAKHFLYKCKDLSIVMAYNQVEQELIKHELNKSEIVTEYRDGTIQVETFKSE